ncbi:hypothetical protein ACWDX6_24050 [Streptomyces sp. NPDC003027]
MAKIKTPSTVTVEFTRAELELVRRALGLVRDFGELNDWDAADELRVDLTEVQP